MCETFSSSAMSRKSRPFSTYSDASQLGESSSGGRGVTKFVAMPTVYLNLSLRVRYNQGMAKRLEAFGPAHAGTLTPRTRLKKVAQRGMRRRSRNMPHKISASRGVATRAGRPLGNPLMQAHRPGGGGHTGSHGEVHQAPGFEGISAESAAVTEANRDAWLAWLEALRAQQSQQGPGNYSHGQSTSPIPGIDMNEWNKIKKRNPTFDPRALPGR
jgi:hypothetical protein